ncbi:MAG TPA: hypothetical protein VHE12_08025 [bacterium]|nr:hypothetical protein [bacterium]
MGKWIGIVAVLFGGFLLYWFEFHKSPAYLAYLQWTKATSEGDCKTLYSISDGDARKWVDFFCTPQGAMTIMGQVTGGMVAADEVRNIRLSPAGSMIGLQHEIKSENTADDGSVDLEVVETVLARPSNFSKPAPPRQHNVKLKEEDGVWKVVQFQSKDL